MTARGYIKIYRRAFTHDFFKRAEFSEREAFFWMIAEAAWEPRQRRLGDYLTNLGRGELVASVRFLAEKWGWDRNRVERFLKRMKNQDMIETRTETGINLITICNYGKYQGEDDAGETVVDEKPRQMRDSTETVPRQMRDKAKEIKHLRIEELKKEGEDIGIASDPPAPDAPDLFKEGRAVAAIDPKPKNLRSSPRTHLPADWRLSSEGWTYAAGKGLSGEVIDAEAERFANYHQSKGTVMADWSAAWRTWVGNASKFSAPMIGGFRPNEKPTRVDSAIAGIARGLARMGEHG